MMCFLRQRAKQPKPQGQIRQIWGKPWNSRTKFYKGPFPSLKGPYY